MDPGPLTLDYANPAGGQPLGSEFVVERHPDGITLARRLRPAWLHALSAAAVATAAVVAVVVAVVDTARTPARNRTEVGLHVAVLLALLAIAGHLFWYARAVGRSRVQAVSLRAGRLVVTNAIWSVWGSRWAFGRPRRFTTGTVRTPLGGLRLSGGVIVRGPLWTGRVFLRNLPRDECVWVAMLLNDALRPDPHLDLHSDGWVRRPAAPPSRRPPVIRRSCPTCSPGPSGRPAAWSTGTG